MGAPSRDVDVVAADWSLVLLEALSPTVEPYRIEIDGLIIPTSVLVEASGLL